MNRVTLVTHVRQDRVREAVPRERAPQAPLRALARGAEVARAVRKNLRVAGEQLAALRAVAVDAFFFLVSLSSSESSSVTESSPFEAGVAASSSGSRRPHRPIVVFVERASRNAASPASSSRQFLSRARGALSFP